jgi:hypothetical protein
VAFYVPLGCRGILLRIGTRLIGICGGFVYWRAWHRRRLSSGSPAVAVRVPEPGDPELQP